MTIKTANLSLDTKFHIVTRHNKSISLTSQESLLLEHLMEHNHTLISRDVIINRLWNTSGVIKTRIVDVYIGYLRKKIDEGFTRKLFHTKRGKGYMISD